MYFGTERRKKRPIKFGKILTEKFVKKYFKNGIVMSS